MLARHQTIVDEDKRGRGMSFVMLAFLGFGPVGALAAGALANAVGAGKTVAFTGVATILIALIFNSRIMRINPTVAPITVEEGIADADAETVMHA